MRRQLLKAIVQQLRRLGKRPERRRTSRPGHPLRFSDVRILEVYFFAVLHALPIREAGDKRNWPICFRGRPLPSPSAMSRRMRTCSVPALLADPDRELVRAPAVGPLRPVSFMDGPPLRIAPHSVDRHARFSHEQGGHAGGSRRRATKPHVLLRADGLIVDWRVTPLGGPEGCEKRVARRTLRSPGLAGYMAADGNYDADPLHAGADAAGLLSVSPKRKRNGVQTGFGHRRRRPGRRRSHALLTGPAGGATAAFGSAPRSARSAVERFFGTLKASHVGLTHLPPWVRTFPRVRPFVTAKLIAHALRTNAAAVQ